VKCVLSGVATAPMILLLLVGCDDLPTDAGPIPESELRVLTQLGVDPDISGDRVVWRTPSLFESVLVVHDLATGVETELTDPGLNVRSPTIEGEFAAFRASPVVTDTTQEPQAEVGIVDLGPASREVKIASTRGVNEFSPQVLDDQRVAFFRSDPRADTPAEAIQIVVRDFRTGAEDTIQRGRFLTNRMGADGDRLVWSGQERRDVPSVLQIDVFLHDVRTGATRLLSGDGVGEGRDQAAPDISGDRVVWQADSDIFLLDLATGELRNLSDDDLNQNDPRIDVNLVVWVEGIPTYLDGEGTEIVAFDLRTGTRRTLTDAEGDQTRPAVSDGRVVWRDRGGEGFAVMMADLR